MVVDIHYPDECFGDGCRQAFDVQVQLDFEKKHTKVTLTVTFEDGRTLEIEMTFCAMEKITTGIHFAHLSNIKEVKLSIFPNLF